MNERMFNKKSSALAGTATVRKNYIFSLTANRGLAHGQKFAEDHIYKNALIGTLIQVGSMSAAEIFIC